MNNMIKMGICEENLQAKIIGMGYSLGSKKIDNRTLSELIGVSAEYIQKATGISHRYWCDNSKDNLYVNMASAFEQSLNSSGLNFSDIDGIVTISNHSGEFLLPNTASIVGALLGYDKLKAYSVASGCAGGLVGLSTVHNELIVNYLQGKEQTIAVIAGDETSKITDPKSLDRALFTDSASCFILTNKYFDDYFFKVKKTDHITTLNNFMVLNQKKDGLVKHNGAKVYNFVSREVPKLAKELEGRVDFSDTYIVPHQPSGRSLASLAKGFNAAGIYLEGVPSIGNSSPASTFIGLEDAFRKSLINANKISLISFDKSIDSLFEPLFLKLPCA